MRPEVVLLALVVSVSACGSSEQDEDTGSSNGDRDPSGDDGRDGGGRGSTTADGEDADVGAIDDSRDDDSASEEDDPPGDDDDSSDDDSNPDDSATDDSANDDVIAPAPGETTRAARLSHTQYDNTVRELLGITDRISNQFAPDALNGFAFGTSINLRVDARLGPQYRAAAEQLAERSVSDPDVYARIVPCSDQSCADEFVSEFGLRAFRRPLSDDEHAAFSAVFSRGGELIGSGNDFDDGVRLVVEAALQSPQFLYRTELETEQSADGSIALGSWSMASRLSYLLYDSMPDPELFAAAASDQLTTNEQITLQVERMLDDPRTLRKFVSFHEQAWHFSRYTQIAPDRSSFPNVPEDLVGRVSEASALYLEDVIAGGGGFAEILTAPYAYADSGLAPLYDLSADGFGDGFQRIDLDPSQRQGLLMQIGFLASNAYSLKTDPIHRGLFVLRDLLCIEIPDPPAGAAETPFPEGAPPPQTTREEIDVLTGQAACSGCHSLFNPAGFAFEGFDAAGQVRTEENGVQVDTSGQIPLGDEPLSFEGPVQLVERLAEYPMALECYSDKWLQFAYGRNLTSDEAAVAQALATPRSVASLVTAIATTPAFISRTPNEVAQ